MQAHRSSVLGLLLGASTGMSIVSACYSESANSSGTVSSGGTGGMQAGSGGVGVSQTGGAAGKGGTTYAGQGGAGHGGAGGALTSWGGAGGEPSKTDKVDLLLMIDNSASMGDKQEILAMAVPELVQRLTNPACIDAQGGLVADQPAKPLDPCPSGTHREFNPVFDIHVGVISSSLGGHGGDVCNEDDGSGLHMQDMAHLSSRDIYDSPVPTYQDSGFLYWDPTRAATPPGEDVASTFSANFSSIVTGAGETGCGYEAGLEAWYRFLIDPTPYRAMVPVSCAEGDYEQNCRAPDGIDATLLSERQSFLRPDSIVVVVMLTDEDDCSLNDSMPQAYLALQRTVNGEPWHMFRGTSACQVDPNSPDCRSCGEASTGTDPECQLKGAQYTDQEDSINLRCYRQKQRFGVDFLYPVGRYVDGLTRSTLADGRVNPLFCSSPSEDGKTCRTPMRPADKVVLGGIVGVPWQDIARDAKDLSKGYKPAEDLTWDVIVGDPEHNKEPLDPLMIPSVNPRTGVNPATGEALQPPNSGPNANSINGHERNVSDDLQYACTFKLPTPIDCGPASCDCVQEGNPLCQDASGQYGSTQYRAKAYPSSRILRVLKGMGDQAMVASICTENADVPGRDDFGYRPAIRALLERLRPHL